MKKEDLEDYRGNFNKYDTNGDELLDADEIIPWVSSFMVTLFTYISNTLYTQH